MSNIKYLIFIIIAFVFVGTFLSIGEFRKNFKGFKKEKVEILLKFSFLVLVLVLIVLGVWVFSYQRKINLCEDKCVSSFEGWRFFDPNVPLIETIFDNQDECINFCQTILKDLQKEEWKSIDLKSIF